MDAAAHVDHDIDPLGMILPRAEDRVLWHCTAQRTAADTGAIVFSYEHRGIGRTLHLDDQARVYGQDPEGVVRLFGRGGPLALVVALNALYDGMDQYRPAEVLLPGDATPVTTGAPPPA